MYRKRSEYFFVRVHNLNLQKMREINYVIFFFLAELFGPGGGKNGEC